MSTSFLYHAFGIRGYQSIRTDDQSGEVFFTITQNLARGQAKIGGRSLLPADRRIRPPAPGRWLRPF